MSECYDRKQYLSQQLEIRSSAVREAKELMRTQQYWVILERLQKLPKVAPKRSGSSSLSFSCGAPHYLTTRRSCCHQCLCSAVRLIISFSTLVQHTCLMIVRPLFFCLSGLKHTTNINNTLLSPSGGLYGSPNIRFHKHTSPNIRLHKSSL
jgi:hypothetical protein